MENATVLMSLLKRCSSLEVIKLEFILRLKIKRNDWLIVDKCPQAATRPQAANHCPLF